MTRETLFEAGGNVLKYGLPISSAGFGIALAIENEYLKLLLNPQVLLLVLIALAGLVAAVIGYISTLVKKQTKIAAAEAETAAETIKREFQQKWDDIKAESERERAHTDAIKSLTQSILTLVTSNGEFANKLNDQMHGNQQAITSVTEVAQHTQEDVRTVSRDLDNLTTLLIGFHDLIIKKLDDIRNHQTS